MGADDLLEGGEGDDKLDGGEGKRDIAIFSDVYSSEDNTINYEIETTIESSGSLGVIKTPITTIKHIGGTQADGVDTLEGIEYAQFNGEQVDFGTLSTTESASADGSETQASVASVTETAPRIIPLPLEDGVKNVASLTVPYTPEPFDNDPPTPPHISLEMPVSMLDGDADFTLNPKHHPHNVEINHKRSL